MRRIKHTTRIIWHKGVPYREDAYTVWVSKRWETNIYADGVSWAKNKERWQNCISKIRNEPIKSGTDLNDITEWGEYEVNDDK